ncbi:MAG: hypothetical protein HPY57_14000 [Ignavibacteria bacterium]|nr:hypothetical protein [Ignavibacteria bacterium]
MKKFIIYIKELFETKNYKWIKKSEYGWIAKFDILDDQYFIHFDSIGLNAYNIYFYYIDLEKNKVYKLLRNIDNRGYKVISNIKNSIEEFIDKNEVDFLGYSSFDDERDSLYMLMLQNICRKDDIYMTKEIRGKKYYFLYKNDISIESNLYIKKFIENDNKIKK